jgi:hypothetical protein
MTDLTKVARTAVATSFPHQVGSFPAHLSSRCWKSTLLRDHTERGSPKYFNGKQARDAGIPERTSLRSTWPYRIGTTELFWKLVHRPVTLPKPSRMLAKFWMSSLKGATKTAASSAYKDVLRMFPRPRSLWMRPSWFALATGKRERHSAHSYLLW